MVECTRVTDIPVSIGVLAFLSRKYASREDMSKKTGLQVGLILSLFRKIFLTIKQLPTGQFFIPSCFAGNAQG